MYLNSLLQKVEDNSLPTSRTVLTFSGIGEATLYCDMLTESFYAWLEECDIVVRAERRQVFEGIAHECSFKIRSLDGAEFMLMGVK